MTGINYNDFNLHDEIDECEDIKKFINNNELPIFKNFDSKYLFKLLRMKKTIFIFNIDKQKLSSLPKLISSIQKILIQRRDLVFGYLDINEDLSLLSFFNIKSEVLPETIIIYDFNKGKYHLDKFINIESLETLINDYDNNKLKWKSGYFIEDFLTNLGFNVNRNILILIIMGFFSIIVITGCIFCFQTLEKIDKKLSSLPRLISSIQKMLIQRRDLIFGYLDINEDISLLSFFNIKSDILHETIIIYDFNKGKYHLDKFINKESLEKLIDDYDNNKLKWKSGYFIEDFLTNLGFNVNRNILILVIMGIFSIIVITACIFCFQTLEKIDKKLR